MAGKQSTFYKLGIALALAVVALFGGMVLTQAGPNDWTDAANTDWYTGDPSYAEYPSYTITTAAELAGIAKLVNAGVANGFAGKTLGIAGDIDLTGHDWVPIGTPEHPFRGALIPKNVGGTVTIRNMDVSTEAVYAGLIGYMDGGTVGGMTFANDGSIQAASVTQAVYAGAAVGYMKNVSTVYDITSSIPITVTTGGQAAYVGGVVGKGEGSISNTNNLGAVTVAATGGGAAYTGGLVGFAEAPLGLQIKKVSNAGAVAATGDAASDVYVGGIAGYGLGAIAMNDDATPISNGGAVTATAGRLNYAGGIVGYAAGDIKFSSNTANAGAVAIEAPASTGSYAGGLIGAIGAEQTDPLFVVAFSHTAGVTNNGGANVYTGGIAGALNTSFTWANDYTNGVSILATGSREVHTGGLVGGTNGVLRFLGEAKNAGAITVSSGTHAGKPDEAYTGGLVGSSSARLLLESDAADAYGNAGAINVTGGAGLYTGGVTGNVAYARTSGEPSDNVYSTGAIAVSGGSLLYTGGFIGTLQASAIDKTVTGASFASAVTVTATSSAADATVSTGGIVGYAVAGTVNDASFSGALTSTGGGAHTYTGGIVGTATGGTIARSGVGKTAAAYATIAGDGGAGGVVGRLTGDGVVDAASVAYVAIT
ncbi:MAG TPA: hypothetical protein VEZ72_00320, partial [Paenibacillus sp.]|nr:hypothetical protein [Paenibacillus sp.]